MTWKTWTVLYSTFRTGQCRDILHIMSLFRKHNTHSIIRRGGNAMHCLYCLDLLDGAGTIVRCGSDWVGYNRSYVMGCVTDAAVSPRAGEPSPR